jgi:predicted nucleotidyltransferase
MSSKNHLKEITQQIVKEVAPDKIILFGSQTKKEQSKESDYDIFVLKNDITHKRKLAQRIYLKLDVDVPVNIIN